MKGKNYLLTTGILIITVAMTVFFLRSSPILIPENWSIPDYVIAPASLLLFITGLFGILFRRRNALICVIVGAIAGICAVVSIPFMFLLGNGSAPAGMLLSSLGITVILAFYLEGALLNRRVLNND